MTISALASAAPAASQTVSSDAPANETASFQTQVRDAMLASEAAAPDQENMDAEPEAATAADLYHDIKADMCRRQASRKLELERCEKQAAAIESATAKKSETEEILERLRIERMRQNIALQRKEQRTLLTEEASRNRQAVEAANRAGEKPVTEHAPVEFHGVSAAELLACL